MDEQVKRVSSGINGLDELIEGGFPEGSNILVTGGPGTGKSVLGLQFIVSGALKGEPGVYLTVEEDRKKIVTQARRFGWDAERLEAEGKLKLISANDPDIEHILNYLNECADQIKAVRVVVDSLSMMSIYGRMVKGAKTQSRINLTMESELNRAQVVLVMEQLENMGTTNFIIAEDQDADKIAAFVADGVISLQKKLIGEELHRLLTVEKMRSTKINGVPKRFELTDKGLVIES